MRTSARTVVLGSMLLIAAVLGSGCERVRSMAKNLKQEGGTKPASQAAYRSDQVTNIDASTYEAFIAQKNRLVVIDFYADWCGPCRRLGPILDKAAAAHPAVVYIGRVNVDQVKQLAVDNQVHAIPDVRIFKDGREVDRFVGCPDESDVLGKIEALTHDINPGPAEQAGDPAKDPAKTGKSFEESVQPMPKNWMPPGIEKR